MRRTSPEDGTILWKGVHASMAHSTRAEKTLKSGSSQNGEIGIISLLLVAILVGQFAVLCYFNFTQLRNHMGYDASWNFLRSALVWQDKALVSSLWSETTNLHLDTHMVLTSLLYGITGNILLAFGIGNTLMILVLLFLMWRILDRLEAPLHGKIIALNLMICPYLMSGYSIFNDLGYFSNILSSASYYTLRMSVILMIIDEYLIIMQERKFGFLPWIVCPLCILCGFSSGVFLIVVILAPCLVYGIEMTVIRNDWKQLIRKESVFAYTCCAFVGMGKVLALKIIGFTALDSTRTWTSLRDLWKNFGAVIQGFLKLLQVLPEVADDKPLMTVAGLSRVFILVIFAVLVVAVVFSFRRVQRNRAEKSGAILFLVNIILVNFLVFGLYNAQYGASIFEERYLITSFYVAIILTALLFGELAGKRVLSAMLSLAMAGSICAVNVYSDNTYLKTTNDAWQMDEIQALAETENAGVVYFWGEDLAVIRRALRPCDMNRVYKELPDNGGWFTHWGDYTTYDRFEEYSGPTLLICPRDQHLVPDSVLGEYTLIDTLDQVEVYASDHNPRLF